MPDHCAPPYGSIQRVTHTHTIKGGTPRKPEWAAPQASRPHFLTIASASTIRIASALSHAH
eukprot:1282324-Prymnesium_polylepis.1